MLKAQGHLAMFMPDVSRADQHDTIMCGHCQRHIRVKPGFGNMVYLISQIKQWTDHLGKHSKIITHEKPGAYCRVCMRNICHPCNKQLRCRPFEKQIERMESTRRNLVEAGIR